MPLTNVSITSVPLLDLDAQYTPIRQQVLQAFEEVLDSKQFILGPKVDQMEKEMAAYCQVNHAIGVSSGTDALVIALMALNIGHGDEVITSPFTFFATAGSIARVGAKAVFVDIDPLTYNIDPSLIKAKITSKTKAIIPVHLFGQMADMDAIMDIAHHHHLYVIEDAAQAIGSEYKGKRAGSIGTIGCFSFFPSKNLGCCGDAGLVTTQNAKIAERLEIMRVHGSKPKYYHHVVGGNFRIDPIQAAVLSIKLPYLEGQHTSRQKNAAYYDRHLAGVVDTPFIAAGNRMIYNQYTIRSHKRDALQAVLNEKKIGNAVYYPVPLHLQDCFKHWGYQNGDFPHSEAAALEVISLPIYAELMPSQQDYVIETIKAFFN